MKKIKKDQPLSLIPEWLLIVLWCVTLGLPNIIYSGIKYADTLHIIKWTVTGVPIGLAMIVAGYRMLRYHDRIKFELDIFALIWLAIIVFCGVQACFVHIFSPNGLYLEYTCLICVFMFYVLSVKSFPNYALKIILFIANLNAAINVLFAELQIRSMNNLSFLSGTIFSDFREFSTLILPTPGNYIGNTAQQNMFGLWVAVAVLGAVYFFVYELTTPTRKNKTLSVIILILCAINFWGLMNSTSRSATLALLGGLIIMLLITLLKFKVYAKRFGAIMLLIGAVFWGSLYAPRSEAIIDKTVDIIQHAETIGLRRGIWLTSYSMLLEHPEGVGLGQYKWHYLEGQRYGFKVTNFDWYEWQYTHWAHNEFLQFFCEEGWIGGTLLVIMFLASIISGLIGVFRSKQVEKTVVWGIGLIALITFCAVFTRPFHRIENMVWITLAFALVNREYLTKKIQFKQKFSLMILGVVFIASSLWGIHYISGGIRGNIILRQAMNAQDPRVKIYLLDEAEKYPIVAEDTKRTKAYFHLEQGEQTHNSEMLQTGLNELWEHFQHEPHSEDISRLLAAAQRYQIEPILRELKSYFKPGTYHLKRVPQVDSNGRQVNALLLMRGPGSDDE